jgi:hypothetical protein
MWKATEVFNQQIPFIYLKNCVYFEKYDVLHMKHNQQAANCHLKLFLR